MGAPLAPRTLTGLSRRLTGTPSRARAAHTGRHTRAPLAHDSQPLASPPSRSAELKSLNLNPAKPHQLAVGASDPLVRVYDRRMLSPGGRALP